MVNMKSEAEPSKPNWMAEGLLALAEEAGNVGAHVPPHRSCIRAWIAKNNNFI